MTPREYWTACRLHWIVDLAEWRDETSKKGELRAYRIDGDITTPLLREALDLEAQVRGLQWSMGE